MEPIPALEPIPEFEPIPAVEPIPAMEPIPVVDPTPPIPILLEGLPIPIPVKNGIITSLKCTIF